MSQEKSLRTYILFWVITLALGMSAILTYQSTQYFLEGFKRVSHRQMIQAADMLPEGLESAEVAFGYHVASSWELVPAPIRSVFQQPPNEHHTLQIHFEDWWYFAPPAKAYSLLSAFNAKGQVRYISRFTQKKAEQTTNRTGITKKNNNTLDPMVVITLWGLGSLLVFVVLVFLVLRRLTQPVRALYNWAKAIDLAPASASSSAQTQTTNSLADIERDAPSNFRYTELNQLAQMIHSNLQKVRHTLAKEKSFLSFASHELRTPIATLRNNATLLDKISPNPSTKEREVRDRILRASLTMKSMTETLLWLNRDNTDDLPMTKTDIASLINRVIAEQRYLLNGKAIRLEVQCTPSEHELPEAAFHILLTNLIRNAFQHSLNGTIRIQQNASSIEIANPMITDDKLSQAGFGLGLKLSRQLVERFGWQLKEQPCDNEMKFTLHLDSRPRNANEMQECTPSR